MTNKKAQSIFTLIFLIIIFMGIWVMFVAEQLSFWGHKVVVEQGLTGLEAFGFENLNLLIFIVFLIFILAYSYIGSR